MVIYFVPVGLILFFVLGAIGIVHNLVESLTSIVYGIFVVLFVVVGIVLMLSSLRNLFYKSEEKKKFMGSFLSVLSESILGLFVTFMLPLTKHWLSIGSGFKSFKEADYVLLGTFEKVDINFAAVIIALGLLIFLFLPLVFIKLSKEKTIVSSIITIIFVCAVFFGGFKVCLDSDMLNSYDYFDWDSAEYETIKDAKIYQSEMIGDVPLITGKFEKGTKLHIRKSEGIINDPSDYVVVSDGNRNGKVCVSDLQHLVEYKYVVNTDANLYEIEYRESMWKGETLRYPWPGNTVIRVIEEGEEVEKISTHGIAMQGTSHLRIKLADGTEGYIEIDKVTEIRE